MLNTDAHIDFETRSGCDLRKAGVFRYAEDATTDTWGFSWRIGVGPISRWMPGDPDPVELLDHIRNGGRVVAHNAAFERTIWNNIVCVRHAPHWPKLRIEQQDCTMARAAAIAHPQDLDKLCRVVGATEQKDQNGYALMMKMAKPHKYLPDGTIMWHDSAANKERLMQYCDQDVATECDVDTRIPPLSDSQRQTWMFDQVINERGIFIDVPAVSKCVALVEYAKKEADKEMRRITSRAVPKCTNDAKLIAWMQGRGLDFDTVKKSVVDDIVFMAELGNDMPIVEAINLRRAAKKTSTAKYQSMMNCVGSDGRIRGLLNYHGAATGRWAGRLVQPQNFARVDYEKEGHVIEWLHALIKTHTVPQIYELLAAVYGSDAPLGILSRALRSMICAAPGNKLIGGDFANIEGRVNSWLAGERWKLQAFEMYDLELGHDLYLIAAGGILGKDPTAVTKAERQAIGKVSELALGFQGSVGAFIQMGETYGVDPYSLPAPVIAATSAEQWDRTAATYAKARNKYGLKEREWTAIKIIVDNWRAKHPLTVQGWWDLQDAAIQAVAAPGQVVGVYGGRVAYYSDGSHLWCVLPSGRMLCYAYASVETKQELAVNRHGEEYLRTVNRVAFWGVDSDTKQWSKQYLYGGLQCENIVQGTACDVMTDRMFGVEQAGFPVILTVHDEIVAEVLDTRTDLNEHLFKQTMSVLPAWADGLPLAASTWEDKRYVK